MFAPRKFASWTSLVYVFIIATSLRYLPPAAFFSRVENETCENPQYIVRMLSYSPLITHIENFVTPKEQVHLVELALPQLKSSKVIDKETGQMIIKSSRTSSSAFLPNNDSIVSCIKNRAAEFQGFMPVHKIEGLQVVRYKESEEYSAHYDWGVANEFRSDRDTTFLAFLEADCEECGTEFPRIAIDWAGEDTRWCEFVDCEKRDSVTFKPVAGSAIFWRNLMSNGTGDPRTLHAGLPLSSGTKIALNIWTMA